MSAVAYSNPYKLPAGALALAVHGAFFVLLYFGVSWQAQPPQGMVVDIWDSLPAPEIAPIRVEPPPLAQAEPPSPVEAARAVAPPKADIESKADIEIEKKKPQAKPVKIRAPVVPPKAVVPKKTDIEIEKKKPQAKPVEIRAPVVPPKAVVPEKTDAEQVDLNAQAERQARVAQAMAEQERVRAEQAAAIGRVMDEHKARIVAKIRRNIVMPPDVPDNAKAEFAVTLLPGGSVLSVKLVKPSGVAVYDSAVERAILKAQPLPLPPDGSLFSRFRELHLKFSAKE